MKKFFLFFLVMGLAVVQPAIAQDNLDKQKISTELETILLNNPGERVKISVLMQEQVDVRALDQAMRSRGMDRQSRVSNLLLNLQQTANRTQRPVLNLLYGNPGVEETSVTPLWIANMILVEANETVIAQLSQMNEVEWIAYEHPPQLEEHVHVKASPEELESVNGREVGHDAIKAPAMWARGYTGYARTAYIVDSGVDGDHPALADNWKGRYVPADQAFFDNQSPFDCDGGTHGSHVAGTVLGLRRQTNDTIGVAPNGLWIGAAVIECPGPSPQSALQWALNPDGDINTVDDIPDVINNSWTQGAAGGECNSSWVQIFNSLEAAGIAVIYAAGNDGPDPSTITAPKNIATDTTNIFTVGAVNGGNPSLPIAGFSSRGPSLCNVPSGSLNIKPEVSAPGVNVRSVGPNNGYQVISGTSMAAPHAAGAILLLKEAFPYLSGRDLLLALYYTAVDRGTAGEDNNYGMGVIDVDAAYNYLVARGNVPVTFDRDLNVRFDEVQNVPEITCDQTITPVVLFVNNGNKNVTSAKVVYSYNGGQTDTVTWTGNAAVNVPQAVILPPQALTPGNYTLNVQILEPNGDDDYFYLDNEGTYSFAVSGDEPTQTTDATVCSGSEAALSASSSTPDSIVWYDAPTGGNFVGGGNVLLTPPLTGTTTYYANVLRGANVGKVDNSGNGLFDQLGTGNYLRFDALQNFRLKSVLVFSQGDGNRNFYVEDAQGNRIIDTTIFVNLGSRRVEIDRVIPKGTDYRIGVIGDARFFRNIDNVTFPYDVAGVVSIKGSSNDQGALKLYYYFYDWEIEYEGACGRTPATATVGSGSVTADFNFSSNPSTGVVSFTDNSTGAVGWKWYFGDGTTSTQQNPTHVYSQAGTYTVTLEATSSGGCSDATAQSLSATVGLEDDLASFGRVRVYPNPGSGLFYLDLELNGSYSVKGEIYDQVGRRVGTIPSGTYGNEVLPLDLSRLENGVYYLRLDINGQSGVEKILLMD